MQPDVLRAKWKQFRNELNHEWTELSSDDLDGIDGKRDNLVYLLTSVFDAARWPASVFRGAFHILFTFVIPLALMTTYPSLALLGKLSLRTAAGAVAGSFLFAAVARAIWLVSSALENVAP